MGRRKQSINDQTEDIECLAHLMKTCGRILDSAKARQLMDQYFDRIQALIANPDMPTRKLERLAEGGVRLEQSYSQQVCTPSRDFHFQRQPMRMVKR